MLVEPPEADESASIEQLYECYHHSILRYCLFLLHGREAIAEELAQETFARLVKHFPVLRERFPWRPKAWLNSTAHNLCIDALRNARVQQSVLETALQPLLRQRGAGAWSASATEAIPPAIRLVPGELLDEDGERVEVSLMAEQGPEWRLFGDNGEQVEQQREVVRLLATHLGQRRSFVSEGWHLLRHVAEEATRISLSELAAEHGLTTAQAKSRLFVARRLARKRAGTLPPELADAVLRGRVGNMAKISRRMQHGGSTGQFAALAARWTEGATSDGILANQSATTAA